LRGADHLAGQTGNFFVRGEDLGRGHFEPWILCAEYRMSGLTSGSEGTLGSF
jgi:hypothetical protein